MSVCIMTMVAVPVGVNLMNGALFAAVTATAAALKLVLDDQPVKNQIERGNTVDLCLENAGEVGGDLRAGQSLSFSGQGIKVIFHQDAEGRTLVRVSGPKSKRELKSIGESIAQKLVQKYAYHRLVTGMKARNMNIVEEEVESDGTVRLKVRVFQGG